MNKVFTIAINFTVAPGVVSGRTFEIPNPNQTALLKSIDWDMRISDAAAPYNVLPLELNTTQVYTLVLGGVGYMLANPFVNVDTIPPAGVVGLIYNGEAAYNFNIGTRHFNSFFIRNNIPFNFGYVNRDPLITYNVAFSVTCEIETIEFVK